VTGDRDRRESVTVMYDGEIVAVSKSDFVAGYKCGSLFWFGKGSRYWSGERKMSCDS
jgi:hypothetical protein